MSDRKLPKSLHTVTVLVNLSRFLMVREPSPKVAIREALQILNLTDLPDVYGLADAALAQLTKNQPAVKQPHKGIDAPYMGPHSVYNLNYRGSDFS